MNPEIKEQWASALESGEYKQTFGKLHDDEGFCGLGVLCDLYQKQSFHEWNLYDDGSCGTVIKYEFLNHTFDLPQKVVEWAELKSANPVVDDKGLTVSDMNDDGMSFEQIASLIRNKL